MKRILPSLFLILASHAFAITAQEVANKAAAASYYTGQDGRAHVTMTITDAQNRERSRELTILRHDETDLGDQRFYVYFQEPADVADTVFLVYKHPDGDDDRWLYLPALDLVRRIAASDERTSFVGSHFYYEDVSGRSPTEDEHELLETTDNYYVLLSKPKQPDKVEFASYKTWIHKSSFLPVKTEYTNKQGKVYRNYQALKVETIQGQPTVMVSKMTDLDRGGSTTLTYSKVQYDLGIEADIFTERYLRTPPHQYLN
ncbi:outer membrane lipoprotein-sorting protein [Coraliomargarita parva]|uniref:outer membrane lipoprotein-sorting protein n=1 Tax=Coraliomargarita parva TaxID=3014050 RepID=UPI0022B462BD|nr:outer membrane lipoprotein-sorting protein [Coraliomargarita parva]